jgi:hypothetical protein
MTTPVPDDKRHALPAHLNTAGGVGCCVSWVTAMMVCST